ncbi:hypothetical protein F4780DRAFT_602850 [Xylariomycetidae sp. FL0641]|nr:hypothetical protein F4780DRAFT_602850 [Xylariomycetidae sp. FL0641]
MKVSVLALAGTASAVPFFNNLSSLPMTTIAGVEVVDTQIVRDAQALIKPFTNYLYTHQMRSWVLGAAMINANATLRRTTDLEVHAVATMLHDLGWDMTPGSPWVSQDKRFEVDGAIGARRWIRAHPDGRHWSEERVQLVWDAISLHGTQSISEYKQQDVATIVRSIGLDYSGPARGVAPDVYDGVTAVFPQNELESGTNQTFIWMCQTKPAATYDTWLQGWGDYFVEGYSAVGNRSIDGFLPPNLVGKPAESS